MQFSIQLHVLGTGLSWYGIGLSEWENIVTAGAMEKNDVI